MIFIIRSESGRVPPLDIKMVRQTPLIVLHDVGPTDAAHVAGRVDFFCLGDPKAAQAAGWPVVPVHDGWYADDGTGGMAIWGQGMFWEVRDTPFTIKLACGPEAWPPGQQQHDNTAEVNVRQAIFRG